jgi:hypothetical protein
MSGIVCRQIKSDKRFAISDCMLSQALNRRAFADAQLTSLCFKPLDDLLFTEVHDHVLDRCAIAVEYVANLYQRKTATAKSHSDFVGELRFLLGQILK